MYNLVDSLNGGNVFNHEESELEDNQIKNEIEIDIDIENEKER
jgi:hypothetical protein